MGDAWFDIASLDHFWILRRYEVLKVLAGDLLAAGLGMAEIGCGHGLLQRQIEEDIGVQVDGYDLNEHAMSLSVSKISGLYCYDIFDRKTELLGKHDVLFLFDVIEHLEDDAGFLACASEHVKPGGFVLVNVPALQSCYSAYDKAVGHIRRYNKRSLADTAEKAGLRIERLSYWGMALLPVLWWRKLTIHGHNSEQIIQKGMKPSSTLANRILLALSRLEPCPQRISGTSLMAVLHKPFQIIP